LAIKSGSEPLAVISASEGFIQIVAFKKYVTSRYLPSFGQTAVRPYKRRVILYRITDQKERIPALPLLPGTKALASLPRASEPHIPTFTGGFCRRTADR